MYKYTSVYTYAHMSTGTCTRSPQSWNPGSCEPPNVLGTEPGCSSKASNLPLSSIFRPEANNFYTKSTTGGYTEMKAT